MMSHASKCKDTKYLLDTKYNVIVLFKIYFLKKYSISNTKIYVPQHHVISQLVHDSERVCNV